MSGITKFFKRGQRSEDGELPEAAPPQPVPTKTSDAPWFELALADKDNVREVPGSGDNPVIVEMLRRTGLPKEYWKDSTAWCGAYVFAKLLDAGVPRSWLPDDPAWAASWRYIGKSTPFRRGCIVCVPSKAAASGFHVTFGNRVVGDKVYCVGGNQSNSVNETAYPLEGAIFRWIELVQSEPKPVPIPSVETAAVKAAPQTPEEYVAKYKAAQIKADKASYVKSVCAKILDHRSEYDRVEKGTGVPWYIVACIHSLESSLNFKTHLHNGDPLTARTVHVPAGRPKTGSAPFSWYESAIDALIYDGSNNVTDWSLGSALAFLEKYNGLGYRKKGIPSPYLWSFTDQYVKGKYVADGKFDSSAVSSQTGAVAILKTLGV